MITHPFVSGGGPKEEIWEITVNTEATTSGAKITGIPINLYSQPGITMTVDWGDGTESVLTSASYSSDSDSAPSVHEYATAGTYIVQMKSTKWKNAYIDVLQNTNTDGLSHIAGFRSTLVGVGQLPRCKGVLYRSSSTSGLSRRIRSFSYCFHGCSALTSIPTGLFDNNPAVEDFSSCFRGCSHLASIPNGLFDNNTVVTNFNACFYGCSNIASIPTGLFDNNPAVTNFSFCFRNCSNITSIPAGLFDNNPEVTDFSFCFRSCSNITSIPAGLFDNNPEVTNFKCCFWDCSKIENIPAGLFHNNSKVTNFHMTFFSCNLSDIPIDIFTNCTAVTDMSGTFGGNNISSVPSGLFSSQTLVTTLGNNMNTANGIFAAGNSSRGVISIDENLFAHMLNLTEARFAFDGHYGFSIRFRATELTDVTAFCSKNTEYPVTVYVPAGSATAEAFHAIANANGIVVVEE